MESFRNHAIIISQPFKTVPEKSFAVLENTINQANKIQKLFKKEKATKYLKK